MGKYIKKKKNVYCFELLEGECERIGMTAYDILPSNTTTENTFPFLECMEVIYDGKVYGGIEEPFYEISVDVPTDVLVSIPIVTDDAVSGYIRDVSIINPFDNLLDMVEYYYYLVTEGTIEELQYFVNNNDNKALRYPKLISLKNMEEVLIKDVNLEYIAYQIDLKKELINYQKVYGKKLDEKAKKKILEKLYSKDWWLRFEQEKLLKWMEDSFFDGYSFVIKAHRKLKKRYLRFQGLEKYVFLIAQAHAVITLGEEETKNIQEEWLSSNTMLQIVAEGYYLPLVMIYKEKGFRWFTQGGDLEAQKYKQSFIAAWGIVLSRMVEVQKIKLDLTEFFGEVSHELGVRGELDVKTEVLKNLTYYMERIDKEETQFVSEELIKMKVDEEILKSENDWLQEYLEELSDVYMIKMIELKKRVDADAAKMLDRLLNFHSNAENIIDEIDTFLEQQINLKNFCYKVDGKMLDYFKNIDMDYDDYDDKDWPDENDYAFITAYAYLIKWLISGDIKSYKHFKEYVLVNFLYGWLRPADERWCWWDDYKEIYALKADNFLKIAVIYIDRFWSVYKKYIRLYIEKNNVDKKILLYGNEDGNKCMDYLFVSAWKTEDLLKKSGIRSKEEYYKISRDIPIEAEIETGGAAVDKLGHSLEVVHMIKIILKKRKTEGEAYSKLYRTLLKTMEDIIETLYSYQFEYEEESYVQDILIKTSEYRKSYALKLTEKITESLLEDDLDKILQCKLELLHIFSKTDATVVACIDENIEKICERIKNLVIKRPLVQKEYELLYENLSRRYTKLEMKSDIFDTLSTAEYLFNEYIEGREPIAGWDYSFISILYYQVLEKVLNYYVYLPYSKSIEKEDYGQNVRAYFGNANCTIINKRRNKVNLKSAIELGPAGFLLKCASNKNSKFSEFIVGKYEDCSLCELEAFGEEVLKISKRRNKAAHSYILNYNEAKEDKYIVYCNRENFNASFELRDMIRRLMSILEGKEH